MRADRHQPSRPGHRKLLIKIGIDGLVLEVVGAGDGPRLARAIRRAWMQLPGPWRGKIEAHCRRPRRSQPAATGLRLVLRSRSLESHLPKARRRGAHTYAWTDDRRGVINFWSPITDRLPPSLLRGLIGHELAHLAMAAAGGSDAASVAADERATDWMARAWRFPTDEIDDWINEHVWYWRLVPVWRTNAAKKK